MVMAQESFGTNPFNLIWLCEDQQMIEKCIFSQIITVIQNYVVVVVVVVLLLLLLLRVLV
jgi:hypothetical protein